MKQDNKNKSKKKTNPPPPSISRPKESKKERMKHFVQTQDKVIFSLFPHISSRPTPSIPTKNLKTHPNKKKSKEKARRKEEERREKEEEGQSKQLNLQTHHQTQVYHVHIAISKVGVSKQDHKSYLNASLSMLD